MKNIIKDALILFVITAVAGVLLAVVNEVTKGPIENQKMQQKQEACAAVFPGEGNVFENIEVADETNPAFVTFLSNNSTSIIEEIYEVKDGSGTLLGYVLTVTNKEGYGGDITFSMGVTLDRTLNGISILTTSETVGLGLEAENVLAPQFAGRNIEGFFNYTKTGATNNNEVDAISSATISTNAYVNGVNAGLAYFDLLLENGGAANE